MPRPNGHGIPIERCWLQCARQPIAEVKHNGSRRVASPAPGPS